MRSLEIVAIEEAIEKLHDELESKELSETAADKIVRDISILEDRLTEIYGDKEFIYHMPAEEDA